MTEEHAIGYQVLPKGTPVEASDGTRVGTFDKAIHLPREHMLDGIVIRTDKGRFFVDAPEVDRITNMRVTLKIEAREIADLPPYKNVMARAGQNVQWRAKRRVNRMRRR